MAQSDDKSSYLTEHLTPEFISQVEELLHFLQGNGYAEHLTTLKKMDALMTLVIAENKYLNDKMDSALMSLMAVTSQITLKDPLKIKSNNELN